MAVSWLINGGYYLTTEPSPGMTLQALEATKISHTSGGLTSNLPRFESVLPSGGLYSDHPWYPGGRIAEKSIWVVFSSNMCCHFHPEHLGNWKWSNWTSIFLEVCWNHQLIRLLYWREGFTESGGLNLQSGISFKTNAALKSLVR